MKYVTTVNGKHFEIEVGNDGRLLVNGAERQVDFLSLGPSLYSVIMNNQSLQVVIDGESGRYDVLMNGHLYESTVLDEHAMMLGQRRGGLLTKSGDVSAPMPGLIVQVPVAIDQMVEEGETLVILESMKMQNELQAPVSGKIESINCSDGQTVDKGALLIVIRPTDA